MSMSVQPNGKPAWADDKVTNRSKISSLTAEKLRIEMPLFAITIRPFEKIMGGDNMH
jgi:hypothetical protein